MQYDRSNADTEVDDPISKTVMWKSWSGKLCFIIPSAINEGLVSTAEVLLGRRGAVAHSFVRQVFIQSLFLQEMKQHSSSPRLFR